MKSCYLRAGSALLLGLAFTAMGCQEDNEAAINEQAARTANVATPGPTGTPPKNNTERGAAYNASKPAPTKGYPGVR